MFSKEKDYLGVLLTQEVIKVAHLKVAGAEHKVVEVIKQDLRADNEADWPKVIHDVLNGLHVKNPLVVCAIPANVVTTKNIEIPSLDPQEIRSIIDLQAGRHTPYSREEILIGYVNIGIFQRNYTKILLIIINRNVIKKQLDLLDQSGIKVDKFHFVPEGIARFYARAMNVKEEETPVGIIDIGHTTTEYIVEFNRTVAMCRSLPIGFVNLIKEGPSAQEKLLAELQKSQEAYQNEDINKLPETYILTSDDTKVKELQPFLQDKLKANVRVLPYLDHIQASQPVMMKLVSDYNDESFLNVIGLVAAIADLQVDLTPDEVKTQRAIEEKGREIIKSGAFGIIAFILVCAIFFSKIYFKGLALNSLEEDYQKKRRSVVVLDRTAQKTRIIKDFINTRMTSLDIINEIYKLIPEEIYLQTILIDENGTINLDGVSESMSRVFNFVSALEDSALFKSVKTKSTTAKKDRGKDVAAFEISFRLESAKDEEEPAEKEAPPKNAKKVEEPAE
jgi:hypothetical protein